MSITGLAARPGTAVEPTCSMRRARAPKTRRISTASAANRAGHSGSYGTRRIVAAAREVMTENECADQRRLCRRLDRPELGDILRTYPKWDLSRRPDTIAIIRITDRAASAQSAASWNIAP